jgi:hypothetical protein
MTYGWVQGRRRRRSKPTPTVERLCGYRGGLQQEDMRILLRGLVSV